MNRLLTTLLVLSLIGTTYQADAQKRIRLGVKFGMPNVLTAQAEVLTPLLGDRIAVAGEFMGLSPTIDDAAVDFSFYDVGVNVYPMSKLLYVGLSYSGFNSDIVLSNVESDDGSLTGGTATTAYDFTSFNIKVGAKIGGLIYFRPEIGYGLGERSETITTDVTFPGGITESQTFDVPGWATSGLIASIGIGISFL